MLFLAFLQIISYPEPSISHNQGRAWYAKCGFGRLELRLQKDAHAIILLDDSSTISGDMVQDLVKSVSTSQNLTILCEEKSRIFLISMDRYQVKPNASEATSRIGKVYHNGKVELGMPFSAK